MSELGMTPLRNNVLKWLAGSYARGLSARTMALTACGLPVEVNHPHDPGDLGRCLDMLRAAPEVRDWFPAIAALSDEWGRLIVRWEELEAAYRTDEANGMGFWRCGRLMAQILGR